MVFNPILCYLSPKIWIFQEPLIVETWNLHHWIWHTSNPKNTPLKLFQCIFPSQNQQNLGKFWLFASLPLTKKEKKCQFVQGKSVQKGLKICTYKCLCMPITVHYVQTLCDKYFLSYDGFSWFLTGRLRHRVWKHSVVVESDPRRIAA